MKIFYSENQVDYNTYTFNYAIYCYKESQSELPEIYEKGFLPYSNNLTIEGDIFYLARSLRVNLSKFEDTSENRRVNRICEPLNIELKITPKKDFDLNNPQFKAFCEGYINERIGEESMSIERWEYILSREIGSHIIEFSSENKPVGYILAAIEQNVLQYWFAFFDTQYMRTHSLGKWIMWRTIRWGKDNGLDYVYLGTAYKSKAMYKVRDHKGLEFFDGAGWNKDMKHLKELCETDENPKELDHFKALENQNEFIKNL